VPEAALALAGQLVDQARASLKAIDKKAVRGGDASQIELLEDAVCEVVFNSSLLMDAAGGLIEAQVALRQMLGNRDEIPMVAGRIRDGLAGRTDPGLVELAAELADFGIDCHLNEDPVDSGQPHWHPSAEAAHHQLWYAALADVARGGTLFPSALVGNGLKHLDDGGAVFSPTGAVPKKSADGKLDGGIRPINDLRACNARARAQAAQVFADTGRTQSPAVQAKMQQIVRQIIMLQGRYQSGVDLLPVDYNGAFRLLWTSLSTALEQTTTLPVSPTLLAKLVALGKRVGQPPVTSEPMFPPQSPRLPTPAENAGGVRDESVLSLVVALGCGSFKSNGRVLSRDEVAARLRRAGGRLGFPEGSLSVISLRSGGASAMFHEGYSAEEIKRRGRWRSECWRTYVWTSRERNHELAGKMLSSSFSLLASLARYERRA
jgi:hypothetical protein